MKFSRRSSIITNAIPVYHKEADILVYAADRAIILHRLTDNNVVSLMTHTDTITVLRFHPTKPHTLLSAGLDGKIVQWNVQTGEKTQQTETRLPIFFMHDYFVGQELKSKHMLRKYKPGFKEYVTIVEDSSPIQCSVGGTNTFVASITSASLSVYWDELEVSTKFTIPHKSGDERRCFTSVAAHPTEFIVATGNRMGEILIWYGLTASEMTLNTANWATNLLHPDPDLLEEIDDEAGGTMITSATTFESLKQADTLFAPVRDEIVARYQNHQTVPYYPVHPSRVHRNLLHWHCQRVQSLCFTSTGSHLLSGGLERVLVKWDMTECLGGPRQRRFIPRLSAPIHRVDSPGGPSEDTVVITLANNGFHVVSGALNVIHTQQGFAQLPSIWRQLSRSPSNYVVPQNLLTLSASSSVTDLHRVPWILTNGAMGDLQLISLTTDRLAVQKLDVTRQSIVPRDHQSRIPVVYSEVMLIATALSDKHGSWLITYDRLIPACASLGDDQSRITWWKWTEFKADSQFPQFEAVGSYSLSHLNCSATDLGCVENSELHAYLLLADARFMIWCHDLSNGITPDLSQWSLKSCRVLSDSDSVCEDRMSCLTVLQPSRNREQTLLLYRDQLALKVFSWSNILSCDPPNPLAAFRFSNLPEPLKPKSIHGKVAVVSLPDDEETDAATHVSHLIAVNIRTMDTSQPHPKRTTTVLTTLTLTRLSRELAEYEMQLSSILSEVHPVCFSVHPFKPWLAVGLTNGQASVFQAGRSLEKRIELCSVCTLPAVQSLPICDRRARHRGGKSRRGVPPRSADGDSNPPVSKTNAGVVTTRLLALEFLTSAVETPDSNLELVGLVETVIGRECNRRDLIVYGTSPGFKNQVSVKWTPKSNSNAGILRLVDPVPTGTLDVHPPIAGRKRKANQMDLTIENALRQVSQYPLMTAPAPEQLLRQLMSETPHPN